jgi:TM2 domain-containing membrane protein YozV
MKKILVSIFLVCGFAWANAATTAEYMLDEVKVEQMFNQSQDITAEAADIMAQYSLADIGDLAGSANAALLGDKKPVVAFILCWVLGGLGIHRFYMGTKTMTGVGYILTCGGLGIVAFIDWIMLLIGLINDDISKYVDNPKFFMW